MIGIHEEQQLRLPVSPTLLTARQLVSCVEDQRASVLSRPPSMQLVLAPPASQPIKQCQQDLKLAPASLQVKKKMHSLLRGP